MPTSIIPTLHLARVYEKLIATYGEPKNEPDNDPLGGLIATILSQHTSDINSGRAYQLLVTAFPTWESARDTATHKIAEAIKCGGLATMKSVRIQDVLHTLTEQQQEQGETKTLAEYLYDELAKRTTEEAWRYLRQLPGVGPKTAACVLMFHLDRPAFPIRRRNGSIHCTSILSGMDGKSAMRNGLHVTHVLFTVNVPMWEV